MPLYNKIQMKTRRGLEWEYLYPKTLTEQVVGYKSFSTISNTTTKQSIEAGMNTTLNLIPGKGISIDVNRSTSSITISSSMDMEALDKLNVILWEDNEIAEESDFILLTEDYMLITTEADIFLRADTNLVTTELLNELITENGIFLEP